MTCPGARLLRPRCGHGLGQSGNTACACAAAGPGGATGFRARQSKPLADWRTQRAPMQGLCLWVITGMLSAATCGPGASTGPRFRSRQYANGYVRLHLGIYRCIPPQTLARPVHAVQWCLHESSFGASRGSPRGSTWDSLFTTTTRSPPLISEQVWSIYWAAALSVCTDKGQRLGMRPVLGVHSHPLSRIHGTGPGMGSHHSPTGKTCPVRM